MRSPVSGKVAIFIEFTTAIGKVALEGLLFGVSALMGDEVAALGEPRLAARYIAFVRLLSVVYSLVLGHSRGVAALIDAAGKVASVGRLPRMKSLVFGHITFLGTLVLAPGKVAPMRLFPGVDQLMTG